MAVYRTVSLNFWSDSKVYEDFTINERYVFLYLLTNTHTNICGCYELGIRQAMDETGLKRSELEAILEKLDKQHNVIRYNSENREVLIINWGKHNWSNSDKLKTAVRKDIEKVKTETFREFLTDVLENGFSADRVSIGYPYPMDTTVAVPVPVTDTEKNKQDTKKKKFIPPTLSEVKEYCQERVREGHPAINPEVFLDYYESQNWKKANGQPVSDWKGCVRTWEKRDKEKPAREPPKKAYQIEGRKYSNDELERMLLGGRA